MLWLDKQLGVVLEVDPSGRSRELPSYVCGHCSDVVVLNPLRTRERRKCIRCGSLICEERAICMAECLPQHALALENSSSPLALRANAVLDGARTSEEVDRMLALT
jgi:hypothetical protein